MKIANGNLLSQSGAGKAVAYTYDVYNRLIQYAEGEKKENYTYDAEGVRRSKVNGNDTIYYISDTAGSLSYTLAETDKDGNVIATYNRADVLISQVREETTSYYLFDGHGDVRALINDAGRISDKYRYNAYGELTERSGETENHYLYTGEYYDGTSNLYYLRARYINPSTGTFISMDTYEGSIYDPDTLHKYLYANANPVKYSDPTGNFFSAAGMLIGTTINSVYNNFETLNVMGILSGFGNATVTQMLGGSDVEITKAFVTGYFTGFALGTITYVVAAYEILTLAQMGLLLASADTVVSMVMTIGSILSGNKKQAIIYGTLSILSVFTFCQLYNLNCTANIIGDKGTAWIKYDNPAEVHGNNKLSTKPQHGYEIYNTETGDVVKTGISGQVLNKNGTSPRANVQVNLLNKKVGYNLYAARVVEVNIPNRALALEWEKCNALRLWKEGNSMSIHSRPQPWK